MPRLHLTHVARIQVVSTCIHLYPLSPSVSCIGDKIVVTANVATCFRLHCIRRHVDGYKLLVRDTCIRLHVLSGVNAALRV